MAPAIISAKGLLQAVPIPELNEAQFLQTVAWAPDEIIVECGEGDTNKAEAWLKKA